MTSTKAHFRILFSVFFTLISLSCIAQDVQDDFEGNSTITSWFGDACGMNNNFSNPVQQGINTSPTVLEYNDTGGQYANVRFDAASNFNFAIKNSFKLNIYVSSGGITGLAPIQISLKLQDGTLAEPWVTQSEIINPIQLDQWQEVTFNFENDNFIEIFIAIFLVENSGFEKVKDAKELAKMTAGYKKMTGQLFVLLCELEEAVLAEDEEKYDEVYDKLKDTKKEGHKTYKAEDE